MSRAHTLQKGVNQRSCRTAVSRWSGCLLVELIYVTAYYATITLPEFGGRVMGPQGSAKWPMTQAGC